MTNTPKRGRVPKAGADLTAREISIVGFMAKGYDSNETAGASGIAFDTVKSHVRRIFQKLEVRSRAQAVAIAIDRGLITTSGEPVDRKPVDQARPTAEATAAGPATVTLPAKLVDDMLAVIKATAKGPPSVALRDRAHAVLRQTWRHLRSVQREPPRSRQR